MNVLDKKGFTLIEVLGVLVVLSIIVLITTPFIQDKITESKKNAFVSDVNGYLRATRNKNTEDGTTSFTISDGKISPTVDTKGEILGKGKIQYNRLGKAKANVWNDKYCAVKSYTDSKIAIIEDVKDYTTCMNK